MHKRFYKIGERILIILAVTIVATVAVKALDKNLGKVAGDFESAVCPADMTRVIYAEGDFCVDRYEASPGDACLYPEPTKQDESRSNIDQAGCNPVSQPGRLPWRGISQNQAAIACSKAGKRLPTNKEWLAAAMGTSDKPSDWTEEDCQVAKNWAKQPGLGGTAPKCLSAAGAYDMIGNVWEWVDGSVADGKYHDTVLPEAGYVAAVDGSAMPSETAKEKGDPNYYNDYMWMKNRGVRVVARGGYWDNGGDAGQYAMYIVSTPAEVGQGIGFRCVK